MTHACTCGCHDNSAHCAASLGPYDLEPDPWKPIGALASALVMAAMERRKERDRGAASEPKMEAHDA